MDVDIRKPVTHQFGIQRPGQSTHSSTSDDDADDSDDEFDNLEDGEGDDNTRILTEARAQFHNRDLATTGNSLDIEEQIAAQPLSDPYPLYDSDDEDAETDVIEEARQSGQKIKFFGLVLKKHLRMVGESVTKLLPTPKPTSIPRTGVQALAFGNEEITQKRFRAPKGKKIHVPVRVEPKVYFAAERTFLSWVRLLSNIIVPLLISIILC